MLSSIKATKHLKLPCRWIIKPCFCRHLNITASDVENSTKHSDSQMTIIPPNKAKVVICGAGVMGAAVAYQLANIGLGPETVILEQAA